MSNEFELDEFAEILESFDATGEMADDEIEIHIHTHNPDWSTVHLTAEDQLAAQAIQSTFEDSNITVERDDERIVLTVPFVYQDVIDELRWQRLILD